MSTKRLNKGHHKLITQGKKIISTTEYCSKICPSSFGTTVSCTAYFNYGRSRRPQQSFQEGNMRLRRETQLSDIGMCISECVCIHMYSACSTRSKSMKKDCVVNNVGVYSFSLQVCLYFQKDLQYQVQIVEIFFSKGLI